MKKLARTLATRLLVLSAASLSPQPARSVAPSFRSGDPSPTRVADLVAPFGLTVSPSFDAALNDLLATFKEEWEARQPIENSFTRRQFNTWTMVFRDLHYRITLAATAPSLTDLQDQPQDYCTAAR